LNEDIVSAGASSSVHDSIFGAALDIYRSVQGHPNGTPDALLESVAILLFAIVNEWERVDKSPDSIPVAAEGVAKAWERIVVEGLEVDALVSPDQT